ncbi:tumor susceptibility gene 101 protein [Cimex lectularius]|uniref:Tumor susceptibility gene 101 protein n=1 Tax=Cimex lectularius TaxID=79782 RepID=A0A8I6RLN9_CIMLE|nr:tumor susceptibility gene 101 protein [Cimex lectularius]
MQGLDSFLKSVYEHPDLTKKDVVKALEGYKALSFKIDQYVANDGTCKNLLSLEGTIPIKYRGNRYNIPICIWLHETHPKFPPICFVKPTPDMQIKVSTCIDYSGRIYLPYLSDWNAKKSDLLNLIRIMTEVFGDNPPLFTKPRETHPVPYPTMPPQGYMPMPAMHDVITNYTPYQMSGITMPTPYPPQMNPTPYENMMGMPSYQQYPMSMPQPSVATTSTVNSGTITDEHIKASLLSAVEDKLRKKMNDQVAQNKAELDILQQTSYELNQGKAKLLDIISKMEKEKSDLERVFTLLKERDAELEKAKADLEERKEVDVDEAVITTAPLYKQILNAYAEEAAIEDAIYYMGEALRRSVIDLDVFLKQIRSLSRKQFTLRALMQKCRHKAGLAY